MLSYLRRVIGLREISIIIIVDLEYLSSRTMSSSSSWGWRQRLQLTRVRPWNICPSLLQGRPSRSAINSSSYLSIYNYPTPIRRLFAGTRVQLGGFLAGKPQRIVGYPDLRLSSEYWHHSHQQDHPSVPSDHQLPVSSSGAVLINFV